MFSDEPVNREADALSRGLLADRIAKIIESNPTRDAIVLSLNGPWGSGKSSVLNMVEDALRQSTSSVVIRFEPWFFNDVGQLVSTFFGVVATALEQAGSDRSGKTVVRDLLKRYRGILSPLAQRIGADLGELTVEEPSQLRKEIAAQSEELKKRIVVLVDDMDRLAPADMLLVLKLVRLCSSFPFFTYLLAFDKLVVRNALAKHFEGDSDFLDKIVQVEIPLPPAQQSDVQKFLNVGLAQIATDNAIDPARLSGGSRSNDSFAAFLGLGRPASPVEEMIDTLRDAKRYLNAIAATLPIVIGEVNYRDFLLLELLRVFFPELYDTVYREKSSFTAIDIDLGHGGDNPRQRARRSFHAGLAESLAKQANGKAAANALALLFPAFGGALRGGGRGAGGDYLEQWAREMRACHPEYFDRYFCLSIGREGISRGRVTALIEALNQARSDAGEMVRSSIADYRDEHRLLDFLSTLLLEVPSLTQDAGAAIVDVLSEQASQLPDTREALLQNSELRVAFYLIVAILKKMVDDEGFDDRFRRIVQATSSLELAVDLVTSLDPQHGQWGKEFSVSLVRSLQSLVSQRVSVELGRQDVFVSHPTTWRMLLEAWNDRVAASKYVVKCVSANQQDWLAIMSFAIDDRDVLDFGTLSKVVSIRALADAAQAASPRVEGVVAERWQMFRFHLTTLTRLMAVIRAIGEAADALVKTERLGGSPQDTFWSENQSLLEKRFSSAPWWQMLKTVFDGERQLRDAIENKLADQRSTRDLAMVVANEAEKVVPLIEDSIERLPSISVRQRIVR